MDFLNQINSRLLGPAGKAVPPAVETIQKITDRLTQSSLLSDRRAAVLSLKSLTRDWKAAVGEHSLPALIAVLEVDAKEDPDIGKAALETLVALCEVDEQDGGSKSKVPKDDLGLKHTDVVLQTPTPIHTILYLLTQPHFYVRFTSVQLLTILVQNRPQQVQQHFLTDPDGPSSVLAIISERREIIRNEALLLTQSLIRSNVDIQKSLAFGGVFEKLISVISTEGGVEGGIVAQDCLLILDGLLQFNASNQSYFRELGLPSALPQLLLYPSPPPSPDDPSPQGFSLQFWDAQKTINAQIVVGMIASLSRGKGISQKSLEQHGITRCLIDLSLSSNAPTAVKTQALLALSPLADLSHQIVTVYIPVPESNGEEWDRLPEESALSALVGVALEGEYVGVMGQAEPGKKETEALQFRSVAASVFESYLYANDKLRLSLLQDLANNNQQQILDETSASLRILRVLSEPPPAPISPIASQRHFFACALLSSLVRGSEACKRAAQAIVPVRLFASLPPPTGTPSPLLSGSPSPSPAPPAPPLGASIPHPANPDDDEDPPQSLLAHLVGSLALLLRSRAIAREQGSVLEITEWDRVLVAYLCLVSVWCWDYEKGVKEILEEGGALGLLVEPVAQGSDVDILVQGISAFLLGICYEFNRETGEVGRPTLHTIIHSRIGLDAFTSALARVRSDVRFKAVSSDSPIVFFDSEGYEVPPTSPEARPSVWLDWSFVEFWKGNSYAIQKAVASDPQAMPSVREVDPETEALVASYKDIIRSQAQELQHLQAQVAELNEQLAKPPPPPPAPVVVAPPPPPSPPPIAPQIAQLQQRIDEIEAELAREQASKRDVEKEQEDLLVLLDELNTKRARDKAKMKEAGMEVSEGEDEDDDDDDDGDDDDE